MGIEREKGGNNSPSLLRIELRQEGRGICQTFLTTTSFVIYCEGLSFCHSARQRDHFTSCFLLYYYWLRWKATSLALTSLKPWTHNMELLPRVPFPWITFHKQQQFNVTKTEFIIFFSKICSSSIISHSKAPKTRIWFPRMLLHPLRWKNQSFHLVSYSWLVYSSSLLPQAFSSDPPIWPQNPCAILLANVPGSPHLVSHQQNLRQSTEQRDASKMQIWSGCTPEPWDD